MKYSLHGGNPSQDNAQYSLFHGGFTLSGTINFLKEKGVSDEVIVGAVRNAELSKVKQQHALSIKHLTGDTTEAERDTWYDQRSAAKDFLSSKASDDQKSMLDDLLIPGETKTQLSKVIMGKNKLMLMLIGKAGGIKRRTEHALSQATAIEEIEAAMSAAEVESAEAVVNYTAAIAALKAQAAS